MATNISTNPVDEQLIFAKEANTDNERRSFPEVLHFGQHHMIPVAVMNRELAQEDDVNEEQDEPLFGVHIKEATRAVRRLFR
jgi:hypothetical protein